MIIDSHVHLARSGYVRGKFLRGNSRMATSLYNRVHKTNITADEYIGKVKGRADPTGEKMIATMDEAGVDKGVIFGVDWAYGVIGEPRVSNREQNYYLAEYSKKHEGRFIPLAALDPRRPDAMEQATQAIEEWGLPFGCLLKTGSKLSRTRKPRLVLPVKSWILLWEKQLKQFLRSRIRECLRFLNLFVVFFFGQGSDYIIPGILHMSA